MPSVSPSCTYCLRSAYSIRCRPSSSAKVTSATLPQARAARFTRLTSDTTDGRHASWLCKSTDRDADLVETMKNDLDKLQNRQAANSLSRNQQSQRQDNGSGDGFGSSLKQTVDKVLIADFFFICAALAWLAAGVAEKSSLNSTRLLDAWYPLWMLVFQPAIGVLMLGALVSGAAGWLRSNKST